MPPLSSITALARLTPLWLALVLGAGCGSPTPPQEPKPVPEEAGGGTAEPLPPAEPAFAGSKVPDAEHSTLRLSRTGGIRADGVDATTAELTVRNRANEPLPGLPVTVSVGEQAASSPQETPSVFQGVTDAQGKVRGSLATTVAGTHFVHARVVAAGGGTLHFVSRLTVQYLPGPPTALRFANPMAAQVAGKPFSPAPYVLAVDAFGNLSPVAEGISLSLGSAPQSTTLSGTVQLPAPEGVAAFTGAYLTLAGSGYTLRAQAPGLPAAESEPFAVEPGESARLVFLDEPPDVVAGQPLPSLRVAHHDAYGNVATRAINLAQVRLLPAREDTHLQGELHASPEQGIVTFSGLRIERAAADYALEVSNHPAQPERSRPFRVLPAAPSAAHSTLEAAPERLLADGIAHSVLSLRVRDAFGNEVPGAPVQFQLEEGQGVLAAAAGESSAWGSASARLTSAQPGRVTVRAQVGGASVRRAVRFASACSVQVGLAGLPAAPLSPTALVADFDADGHVDLAAGDSGGLKLARGFGDGTFGTPQPIAPYAGTLAAGDLDGNGTLDLVRAGAGISVFSGRGDGTFAPPQTTTSSDGSYGRIVWVQLADVSGDGLLDVLYSEGGLWGGGLGVRINQGGGRLSPHTVWPAPAGLPLLHDVTGDGRADLVFPDHYGGAAKLLRGSAGGGFEPELSYPAGTSPESVVAGDVDGDGDVDLLVLRRNEPPTLLRQGAGQAFQLETEPLVGRSGRVSAKAAALADLDGDGDLDAALTDEFFRNVRVFHNDGAGRFEEDAAYPQATDELTRLRLEDLDHDGRPELLLDDGAVLRNRGDGTFAAPTLYAAAAWGAPHVVVEDWDQDGHLDVASVGDWSSVLRGTGGGALASAAVFNMQTTTGVVHGDFDGDGRSELGLVRSVGLALDLYEADASGALTLSTSVSLPRRPTALHAADLDGNGTRDLVLLDEHAGVAQVLSNAGDATFAASGAISVGAAPISVTAGDLNGDGRLDLVVSRTFHKELVVLLALAGGGYGPPVSLAFTGDAGSALVADLDGDGHEDLAVPVSGWSTYALVVLPGQGDGTFGARRELPLRAPLGRLELADLNADGKPDLFAQGGGSFSLLLGDGDGAFAPPLAYGRGMGLGRGVLADLDGDGRLDLVSQRQGRLGSEVAVLLNHCLR